MRRLGRSTLNALSALSLLLCVAAAALWVRSHATRDAVQYAQIREVRIFYAISEDGQLLLARRSFPEEYREAVEVFVGDVGPRYVTLLGLVTPPPDYVRRWAGIRISEGRDGDGGRLAMIAVPFWAVVLLFALAGMPAVRSAPPPASFVPGPGGGIISAFPVDTTSASHRSDARNAAPHRGETMHGLPAEE
jgi:hypothetical protein